MVDESNEKYDGEEGEYHFSDDHASYELESETLKTPTPSAKEPGGNVLAKYRRVIIVGSIFIVLMFVVYKMISPTAIVAPPTDFSKATPAPAVSKPTTTVAETIKPTMEVPVPVPTTAPAPPATPAVAEAQPVPPPMPAPPVTMPEAPVATATPTHVAAPAMQPSPPPPLSPSPVEMATTPVVPKSPSVAPPPIPITPQGNIASAQQPVVTVIPAAPTSPPAQIAAPGTIPPAPLQSNDINERVAALEQQNAKLTNLLQIEYSQKMSDQDSQNTVMRNKILELNKRLASMESALSQITQLLQETASGKAMPVASSTYMPPTRVVEPKLTYAVQAIIPGRAWLKSDSGETITVAEGDMLKSYGRVTKIDPYDGIVQIYTGNKTITLSYGLNGDA